MKAPRYGSFQGGSRPFVPPVDPRMGFVSDSFSVGVQRNLCKTATQKRPKIVFQDQLSLNSWQKYCRMLLQF